MSGLLKVIDALQKSWSRDTSYNSEDYDRAASTARGQCAISALVIQDYMGGDLVRVEVEGPQIHEKHYFNKLDNGMVIDATRSQYVERVTMTDSVIDLEKDGFQSAREKLLADEDTRRRYAILKQRVAMKLGEN